VVADTGQMHMKAMHMKEMHRSTVRGCMGSAVCVDIDREVYWSIGLNKASCSLNDDNIQHILSILLAKPTLFVNKIQEHLWTEQDIWVSISTILHVLDCIGWSKKRLSREAAEHNHLLHCAWKAKYGSIPMHYFLWIDKSGIEDHNHL
jgi:hypothetical protein